MDFSETVLHDRIPFKQNKPNPSTSEKIIFKASYQKVSEVPSQKRRMPRVRSLALTDARCPCAAAVPRRALSAGRGAAANRLAS